MHIELLQLINFARGLFPLSEKKRKKRVFGMMHSGGARMCV